MADKRTTEFPFEGEDRERNALWAALGDIPQEDPGPDLRRQFYRGLEQAQQPSLATRIYSWLGFAGNHGWATAGACVLLGVLLGVGLGVVGNGADAERLAALEANISALNRNLILDRLSSTEPGKRLQGVMDAAYVVAGDAEITEALLARATDDRLTSIRSAAIDALAPELASPGTGEQLMAMLEQADSPLVQLALIDLVLQYGNANQVSELQKLVRAQRLHPDLEHYIKQSLGEERT